MQPGSWCKARVVYCLLGDLAARACDVTRAGPPWPASQHDVAGRQASVRMSSPFNTKVRRPKPFCRSIHSFRAISVGLILASTGEASCSSWPAVHQCSMVATSRSILAVSAPRVLCVWPGDVWQLTPGCIAIATMLKALRASTCSTPGVLGYKRVQKLRQQVCLCGPDGLISRHTCCEVAGICMH